ncbi:MAG: methyltransferase domain-containing protein [Candidatus Omnitrophota bacterium]
MSDYVKAILRKALPVRLRQFIRRWLPVFGENKKISVSAHYEIVPDAGDLASSPGWRNPEVAKRQEDAFAPLLEEMRKGNPRDDFKALAKAMEMVDVDNPLVIEIGCGSGWNYEVLSTLWQKPFRYIGMDISLAMVSTGHKNYPDAHFLIGDGMELPFQNKMCDVLLSGTALMHLHDYRKAIEESHRAAKSWCIFHAVPVIRQKETSFLRKDAYGEPTIEVIFNEDELKHLFCQYGFVIRHELKNMPYNLESIMGKPTELKTYVCRIVDR